MTKKQLIEKLKPLSDDEEIGVLDSTGEEIHVLDVWVNDNPTEIEFRAVIVPDE